MHDGPQVPNRMRKNASYSRHLGAGAGYRCLCGREYKTRSGLSKHGKRCEQYVVGEKEFHAKIKYERMESSQAEGKIKCELCDFWGHNLTEHISNIHNISKEEYKGETLSKRAFENYSNQNKYNGDWIARANERGENLSEYKRKMSQSVSQSVLSNPTERKRRAILLGELNKTDEFRKKASETAIKTSAKPEIIAQRSERLRKWRENNPEEFRTKCWEKMVRSQKKWKKTKPEKWFQKWVNQQYPNTFEYGKMLRNNQFKRSGKSDRKQIDFRSKDRKIYIEIDGPFHFENMTREKKIESSIFREAIEKTRLRDRILEEVIEKKQKCLIRIGYGCWVDSTGRIKQTILDKVKEIIDNKQTGIFKLGEEYGEDNCI